MPRKKGGTIGSKTLIVRVSEQLDDDLRTAAAGLGVDVSNLVRMMFIEQVPVYIERGLDAQRRTESARARASHNSEMPDKKKPGKRTSKKGPSIGPVEGERFLDPS